MVKSLHPNLLQVVKVLNDGAYHNGNEIGQLLKISRSAVWKYIHRLKKYGVLLSSSKSNGYQLQGPLILIEAQKIKQHLTEKKKTNLLVFESIGSTNEYLKSLKKMTSPVICIAEHQSRGKARLSRSWASPFGKNIYLSCRYSFDKDVSELAGLSLVAGLAVYRTLQSFNISHGLSVKWPNDIYFNDQKLCGILLEVQSESQDGLSHAIIGIGLNVNMASVDLTISREWTSLQKILEAPQDRNIICSRLINYLLEYLKAFQERGFAPFHKEWENADCLYQKKITLKTITTEVTGQVLGVNARGLLLLKLDDGSSSAFSSGDVTILNPVMPACL